MRWARKVRLDDFILLYIGISIVYFYRTEVRLNKLFYEKKEEIGSNCESVLLMKQARRQEEKK